MPADDLDPGANTEMFRAFVERDEPPTQSRAVKPALVAVAAVAAAMLVALVWVLATR